MKMLLILSVFLAIANSLPSTRSQFCDCKEIMVSSTGAAAEKYPDYMGKYTYEASLWEGMVPLWKNSNDIYLTPDPNSNPILYYIKWVFADSVGGYNGKILNDVYLNGFEKCPFEMDQWKYEWEYNWYTDQDFTVTCTKN